jgi:hypothetical protein
MSLSAMRMSVETPEGASQQSAPGDSTAGHSPPSLTGVCKSQALLAVHAAARHKQQVLSRAGSLESEQTADATLTGERPNRGLLETLTVGNAGTDPEARVLISEQLRIVAPGARGTNRQRAYGPGRHAQRHDLQAARTTRRWHYESRRSREAHARCRNG